MLKTLLHGFIDLLYPRNCHICKQYLANNLPHEFVCQNCASKIKMNKPPFCISCFRHINAYPPTPKCSNCSTHHYHFDFVWSACFYQEPLRKHLHTYKFHQQTLFKYLFADILVNFIKAHQLDIQQFDFIVPIPLSSTRQRERGYNHTHLLAQLISTRFHIPLSYKNLIRHRHTKYQSSLSQKERWTNIHGAFKIKHPASFTNKSILIMDDLLTTGATASEAAKTIKKTGANTVGVITLAFAQLD